MSLRSLLKRRIVSDVIEDAKSKMAKKYSLIVGDDVTIKILHHCFRMHELNDLNIGVVVNVMYDRERVRISPIYFLSGSHDSVTKMVQDYENPKQARYAAPVHAYFCSPVEPRSVQLIKDSPIRRYLATMTELPCDFLVKERRVFTLARDEAFIQLYHQNEVRMEELGRTAQQLVGVCLTVGEDPHIRYSASSRIAMQLAQLFDRRFQEVKASLQKWSPRADRGTMIILDRADDPLTPLLHEMTFQSMVMDLLNSEIKKDSTEMKGREEMKNESLELPTEEDTVWTEYRHGFIGDIVQELPKKFKDWRDKSAVAKYKSRQKQGGDISSKDLQAAAKDMPQYQAQIKRYTQNIDMADRVNRVFRQQNLLDVITLEQDIATGIDDSGKKCDRSKLSKRLSQEILIAEDKELELKLRLFMIYLIAQGGLKPDIRRSLMEQSGFRDQEENTILGLGSLRVQLQSTSPSQGHHVKAYWKHVQSKAKAMKDSTQLYRFTPLFEWALDNHIGNSLPKEDFPWISEPPKARRKQRGGQSLREKYGRKKPDARKEQQGGGDDKPRVIVFVLGGVTYSELCAVYRLSQEKNVDVFVGSTSILSPQKYMQLLSEHSS